MPASTDPIHEVLTRGVEQVVVRKKLEERLRSGERLRLYLGIDPSTAHLHLGHAVPLFILRRLQDLGHEIILLIGDYTARIGDPTDKQAVRQPLSEAAIQDNLQNFQKQAGKIIRFTGENAATLRFNSEWFRMLTFAEVLGLAQEFTVQQLLERDMFEERLQHNKPIGFHEFFYPVMQGYDSVMLDVDLEVGGNDQLFNMLAGRQLMASHRHKEKHVMTAKLLANPKTGKKMSKTEGTVINLDAAPQEMFGKVMALPDEMIISVANLATSLSLSEVSTLEKGLRSGNLHPRDAKLQLAAEIVRFFHTPAAADEAEAEFLRIFSEGQQPVDIPSVTLSAGPRRLDRLVLDAGLASSRSAAQRLIEGGGVRLDDHVLVDWHAEITPASGQILQVGKRLFRKITLVD